VRILSPVAVVATGALLRPRAAACPVEMVAHTVPLMLGSAALHDRAAPDQAAAGAPAASGASTAAAAGTAVLPLLLAARRILHESRPLLDVLHPALLPFPEGQRWLLSDCSARALPQHAVDEIRHQPGMRRPLEALHWHPFFHRVSTTIILKTNIACPHSTILKSIFFCG
jgi:hypothetical protein